jgi:hypothetical protein
VNRFDCLRNGVIPIIPFKGIPEFKQVQLFRNYRKFGVPLEFQDEIAPQPHKDVLKRQEKDKRKGEKQKSLQRLRLRRRELYPSS